MTVRPRFLAGLLGVLSACGCTSLGAAMREPVPDDRSSPEIAMPHVRRVRIPSGLTVSSVRNTDVGVVRISLVMRAGFGADPPGKAGLSRLVASQLELASRSPREGTRFGLLGTTPTFEVSRAGLTLSIDVLPQELDDGLRALAEFVNQPLPMADTIELARTRRISALVAAQRSPEFLAGLAIARLLDSGGTDIGSLGYGSRRSLDAITVADTEAFLAAAVSAKESAVVVAGPVDTANVPLVVQAEFASWPAGEFRPPPGDMRSTSEDPRIAFVPVPGMSQTLISIAGHRPHSSGSETSAFDAALARFAGQLHHRLRVVRQLSYGLTRVPTETSVFAVAIRVRGDRCRVALNEVRHALFEAAELPSTEWVSVYRRATSVTMMTGAQDSAAMATHGVAIFLRGDSTDTLLDESRGVQLLDDDVVQTAGKRELAKGQVRIVVVGDPAIVRPQLGTDIVTWSPATLVGE